MARQWSVLNRGPGDATPLIGLTHAARCAGTTPSPCRLWPQAQRPLLARFTAVNVNDCCCFDRPHLRVILCQPGRSPHKQGKSWSKRWHKDRGSHFVAVTSYRVYLAWKCWQCDMPNQDKTWHTKVEGCCHWQTALFVWMCACLMSPLSFVCVLVYVSFGVMCFTVCRFCMSFVVLPSTVWLVWVCAFPVMCCSPLFCWCGCVPVGVLQSAVLCVCVCACVRACVCVCLLVCCSPLFCWCGCVRVRWCAAVHCFVGVGLCVSGGVLQSTVLLVWVCACLVVCCSPLFCWCAYVRVRRWTVVHCYVGVGVCVSVDVL